MRNYDYQVDWEEFAEIDKKWSILTDPQKKYNKWRDKDFFQTGDLEVGKLLELIKSKNLGIKKERALDFGCGVGRTTQALAKYFNEAYGVDISEKMILAAKDIHRKNKKLIFSQNRKNNLKCFNDNQFDLVFSVIVLQHIPSQEQIKKFLEEFIRVLNPRGILYFQLPSIRNYNWLKEKLLKLRGFLYYFFTNRMGLSKFFCYQKLKLAPFMHMTHIDSNEIIKIFKESKMNFWIFNDKSRDTVYLTKKL